MIGRATATLVAKPWGQNELAPWHSRGSSGENVGEVWFDRPDASSSVCALRLKLLYAAEPLSIQVHPDDACAVSVGLAHGKSEAWYVLSAAAGAQVALGLESPASTAALRAAIDDGSIATRVRWRRVAAGESYFVSGGTIHSIGPGLVIVEIQQLSNVTYRLFDFGRGRALNAELGVAAANANQQATQPARRRLSSARTQLVACPSFVLELLELPAGTTWQLSASSETWAFALDGCAAFGALESRMGDAICMTDIQTEVMAGSHGWKGLVAYVAARPAAGLLSPQVGRAGAGALA